MVQQKLTKAQCLQYYKRKDVQEAIVAQARDREIGVCFGANRYGKRPDVLVYPQDVLELVKRGATSFHCSEERWSNPLTLGPELKQNDLNDLRIGWDLILDIDCKFLHYSKIAGKLIVDALRHHDIESLRVKFSGNHGFHLVVPFEAFPNEVNGVPTRVLFPQGPRKIAKYLQHMIREPLAQELLATHSLPALAKNCGKTVSDLMGAKGFDPFTIVDIDTILISSRHLFRMPYSFNEKSGLVSVPISPDGIMDFDIESAKYQNVTVDHEFITYKPAENDARRLFMQAYDFTPPEDRQKQKTSPTSEFKAYPEQIPQELFPPCIQRIDRPLEDGKKRAMFILINFLQSVGWPPDQIEEYVYAWNSRQPSPLREVYLKGQLRYVREGQRIKLPPNCTNQGYYQDLMLCQPDSFCKRIKNPANYSILKHKISEEMRKKREAAEEKKAKAEQRKKKAAEKRKAKENKQAQSEQTTGEPDNSRSDTRQANPADEHKEE